MAYDQKRVFLSFELQNNRFKSRDDVKIRFASRVSITKLVLLPGAILLREFHLHLLVRQTVANSDFNFAQCPPLHIFLAVNSLICQKKIIQTNTNQLWQVEYKMTT